MLPPPPSPKLEEYSLSSPRNCLTTNIGLTQNMRLSVCLFFLPCFSPKNVYTNNFPLAEIPQGNYSFFSPSEYWAQFTQNLIRHIKKDPVSPRRLVEQDSVT